LGWLTGKVFGLGAWLLLRFIMNVFQQLADPALKELTQLIDCFYLYPHCIFLVKRGQSGATQARGSGDICDL
jgi:hypothetical protein